MKKKHKKGLFFFFFKDTLVILNIRLLCQQILEYANCIPLQKGVP